MDQRNENREKKETESNTEEVDLKERYKIEKCVEIAGSKIQNFRQISDLFSQI